MSRPFTTDKNADPVFTSNTSAFDTILSHTAALTSGKSYLVLVWGTLQSGDTTDSHWLDIRNTTDDILIGEPEIRAQTSSAQVPWMTMRRLQPASTANRTITVKAKARSSTGCSVWAQIVVIEMDAADVYAELDANTPTTSITMADLASLTTGSGQWILLATTEATADTAGRWKGQLTTGVSGVGLMNPLHHYANRFGPFATMNVVNAGTHALQHCTANAANTARARHTRLVAIKKNTDDGFAFSPVRGIASTTATTLSTRCNNGPATLEQVPHLVLATATLYSSANIDVQADILATDTPGGANSVTSRTARVSVAASSYDGSFAFGFIDTPGASNRAHHLRYASSNGTSVSIEDAIIAAIELAQPVSATRQIGLVASVGAAAHEQQLAAGEKPGAAIAVIDDANSRIGLRRLGDSAITWLGLPGAPNARTGDLRWGVDLNDGTPVSEATRRLSPLLVALDRVPSADDQTWLLDLAADLYAPVVRNGTAALPSGGTQGQEYTLDIAGQIDTKGFTVTVSAVTVLEGNLTAAAGIGRTVRVTPAVQIGTALLLVTVANDCDRPRSRTLTLTVTWDFTTAPVVYANGYAYRRRVQVRAGLAASDIANGRVLIVASAAWLKSVANAGKVTSASGHDIRFELPDGTKLDHDREYYDPASGDLVAWARLPSLPTLGTSFYVYYGKSGAADEANAGGVWSGYAAVWHGPDGADRSGNGRNLAPQGTTATSVLIGPALSVAGAGTLVRADADFLHDKGALTIEAWVKADSPGTDRGFVAIGAISGTDEATRFGLRHDAVGFRGGRSNTITAEWQHSDRRVRIEAGDNAATAALQRIALVIQAAQEPRLYAGTSRLALSHFGGIANGNTDMGSSQPLTLGAGPLDTSTGGWRGLIDAVRVRTTAVSDAEIKAEAEAEAWPALALSLGSEETGGSTAYVLAPPRVSSTTTGAAVSVDLLTGATGTGLSVISLGTAGNGTVAAETGGRARYTPNAAFAGRDVFAYTLQDSAGRQATGYVGIDVAASTSGTLDFDEPWVGTFVGNPLHGDTIANSAVRGGEYAWLLIDVEYTGSTTGVTWEMRRRNSTADNTSYSGGAGGRWVLELRRRTGDGLGPDLSAAGLIAESNVNNGFVGDICTDGIRNTAFAALQYWAWKVSANVTRGQKLAIVWRNIDTTWGNYSSVNLQKAYDSIPAGSGYRAGPYYGDMTFFKWTIDSVSPNGRIEQRPTEGGLWELRYSNGKAFGNYAYFSTGTAQKWVGGQNMARMPLVLAKAKRVKALWFRCWYSPGTTPSDLVVRLERSDGSEIETVSVPRSQIAETSNPQSGVVDGTDPAFWVRVALSQTRTLEAGTYRAVLSAATGQYRFGALQFKVDATIKSQHLTTGNYAQHSTNGGTSWVDGWNRDDGVGGTTQDWQLSVAYECDTTATGTSNPLTALVLTMDADVVALRQARIDAGTAVWVAPDGNDAAAGSEAAPLRTFAAAFAKTGKNCLCLRGPSGSTTGHFYVTAQTVVPSGWLVTRHLDHLIVIHGGELLSGSWTLDTGIRYRTAYTGAEAFHFHYGQGGTGLMRTMTRGRFPKEPVDWTPSALMDSVLPNQRVWQGGTADNTAQWAAGTGMPAPSGIGTLRGYRSAQNQWFRFRGTIAPPSFDFANRTVVWAGLPGWTGLRYGAAAAPGTTSNESVGWKLTDHMVFEGDLNWVTNQREFGGNPGSLFHFCPPHSGAPLNAELPVIGRATTVFRTTGADVTFAGITIVDGALPTPSAANQGADVGGQNAAIVCVDATNPRVNACRLGGFWNGAAFLHCTNPKAQRNRVADMANHGLYYGPTAFSSPKTTNPLAEGNLVHHVGWMVMDGSGCHVHGSTDIRITRNIFLYCAQSGATAQSYKAGDGGTAADRCDRGLIDYNIVRHVNPWCMDGGAIKLFNAGTGNCNDIIVEKNWIDECLIGGIDVNGTKILPTSWGSVYVHPIGAGVYHDQWMVRCHVRKNIITRSYHGFMFKAPWDCNYEDNIVWETVGPCVFMDNVATKAWPATNYKQNFRRNVFKGLNTWNYYNWQHSGAKADAPDFAGNIWATAKRWQVGTSGGSPTINSTSLTDWINSTYTTGTEWVEDPLLVKPSAPEWDFALQAGSPLPTRGIPAPDAVLLGLMKNFADPVNAAGIPA